MDKVLKGAISKKLIIILLATLASCSIGGLILYDFLFNSPSSITSLQGKSDWLIYETVNGLYAVDMSTGDLWNWELPDGICRAGLISQANHQAITFAGAPSPNCTDVQPDGIYELSKNGNIVQVSTLQLDNFGEHAWSPTRQVVAYFRWNGVHTTTPEFNLYVHPLNDEEEHLLTDAGSFPGSLHWSKDEQIIFTKCEYSNIGFTCSIHKISQAGNDFIELSEYLGGSKDRPQWSPDATKIAFLHAATTSEPQSIWIMNADGSDAHPVFTPQNPSNSSRVGGVQAFAWSPDGSQIAFASGHEGPCWTSGMDATMYHCPTPIYLIDLKSKTLRKAIEETWAYPIKLLWIQ